MCGIFGALSRSNNHTPSLVLTKKAIEAVAHRGPDFQSAIQVHQSVTLAHARLSIIDTRSVANQPFQYLNYVIIFNGEIFNYVEIKQQLGDIGYEFSTNSDTEVVLAAYDYWKEDCVLHFNGMWSFAIFDQENEKLFCSRDRFGIKPFVYHRNDDELLFGSEAKSILAYKPKLGTPNFSAIASYLKESTGGESEFTWFAGIKRLLPAHNLIINIKDGSINIKRYWDYPKPTPGRAFDIKNDTAVFRKLFDNAINIRLRSDVPLGATLSSGLDSSTIAYVAAQQLPIPLKCYTATFSDFARDEYADAKKFTKGKFIDHIPVYSKYKDILPVLESLIYHLEMGHSSPAIFPLYYINKESSKEITVFLEGQGADELLGGYIEKNIFVVLLEHLWKGQFRRFFQSAKHFSNRYNMLQGLVLYLRGIDISWLNKLMRIYYGHEYIYGASIDKEPLNRSPSSTKRWRNLHAYLVEQHKRGLVNLLHYGDAIAMMFSLENRVPYLDFRLVEFVFSLPTEAKVSKGYGKYIQRLAFQHDLDKSIVFNAEKKGFPSPINTVFKEDSAAIDLLMSTSFLKQGIIKEQSLKKLIKDHQNDRKDNSRLLFRLLCVALWFKTFINE